MKRFALLLALGLINCTHSGEDVSPDGGFGGKTSGCVDFVVLRESGDGLRVLEIEHYQANHSGDTTYEVQVSEWDGTVRASTYNRAGGMEYFHCNDVAYEGHPVKLKSLDAVSGRLAITVYGFSADTNYFGPDSSYAFIWKDYFLDVELRDAVFEDGSTIDSVRMDSVPVGWIPG